jgi:hypothetical protein
MDKIILDIDCWRQWSTEETIPIEVNCLPSRFTLYLNPLLYLRRAKTEKVEWSEFQQQALSWLERSPHQLFSSTYLCDLATGQPQGEILTLKGMKEIQVFKNETLAFQVAEKMSPARIQNYLKRFDIIFTPSPTCVKQPTLFNLIKSRHTILSPLQRQHKAYHTYLAVNVSAVVVCIILAAGAAASSLKWWQGLKQLQHSEAQSVLTPDQEEQASLYQDFCHLTAAAQLPHWTAYQKFLAIWRQKIVITQITYENNAMSCSFVIHPDYAIEIDQLMEWLEQNLPGSKLTEGEERNVDFHLSFAPA